MNYLQKEMECYNKWRKGVLLLMPLEVLLSIVVLGLLIAAFITGYASTKGTLALTDLRNYLTALQRRFSHSADMDAEAERSDLEKLLNNVKVTCEQQVISSDADFQLQLGRACDQMTTITKSQVDSKKSTWIKLKAVACGFSESYFPGFIKRNLKPCIVVR